MDCNQIFKGDDPNHCRPQDNHPLFFAILTAITEGKVVDDVIGEGNGNYDVELRINGIELNPIHAFEQWEKQFDKMLEEKAKNLIEHKIGEFDDMLYDLKNELKRGIAKKLNIKVDLDDEY